MITADVHGGNGAFGDWGTMKTEALRGAVTADGGSGHRARHIVGFLKRALLHGRKPVSGNCEAMSCSLGRLLLWANRRAR